MSTGAPALGTAAASRAGFLGHAVGWGPALMRRLRRWRAKRRVSPLWTVAVAVIVLLMLLPILAIVVIALGASDGAWHEIVAPQTRRAALRTLWLLGGVGALTLLIGTGTAWLVSMYRFPWRDRLDWMLVVPLAMPTYIIAFCYVEILDYSSFLQTALRELFGWRNARDYWFPEIRSLGGAVFVMSFVLYPYVYLSARASFLQQSVCTLEVARTLGQTSLGVFWRVALPLARPALAAGVTMALMESLNDIGAVEYLGVRTLTVRVYTTWLERSSLGAAAQLAGLMLGVVFLLLMLERAARSGRRFHHTTGRYRAMPPERLRGLRAWLASAVCALPLLIGFVLPASVLVQNAIRFAGDALSERFWQAALNSLLLSAAAALAAVTFALVLAYARRVAGNGLTRPAVGLASLGYAVPGTVLAVGLLIPLAGFDNWLDGLMRARFGFSTGLLLSGSVFALLFAYTIRFMAIALGAVDAGLGRISPNLDAAARTLGETVLGTLWRIHLPLLQSALATAALLVFVDAMKELPATLLLRPFNFETLATHVYDFASLEQFEEAAIGALAIVAIGLVPVILLHRTVARGRAGDRGALAPRALEEH